MNKFIQFKYVLATFLFSSLIFGLNAQNQEKPKQEKKSKTEIIIIEETSDADGNKRIKKTIRTEGDLSDEELQQILKDELGEDMDIEMILDADNYDADAEKLHEKHGYLGVTIEKSEAGEGVVINEVMTDSPAEKANLTTGDIITSVEGNKITTPQDLVQTIQNFEPGATVRISFVRDGQTQSANAELAARKSSYVQFNMPKQAFGWVEKEHEEEIEKEHEKEIEKEFEKEKPRLGVYIDDSENGVAVTGIIDGSLAADAGLKEGDIITHFGNQQVSSPDALIEAVKAAKEGKKTKLRYLRNGKEETVSIRF